MKIVSIKAHKYKINLAEPIADARDTIYNRSCVLVKVETDKGIVGWGESASFAGCEDLVVETINFLAQMIVGKDPLMIASIYNHVYRRTHHYGRRGLVICALSGIDIALWDILGKCANLPLYKILGASRNRIKFYFNAGYYSGENDLETLKQSLEMCLERRPSGIKIKIGRHGTDDDIERITVARKIIGYDLDLMVDANSSMNRRKLEYLDPALVQYQVRWLEEPVPIQKVSILSEIRRRMSIPIAGYEIEMTLAGFTELIEGGTVDVVQPDTIWSGGITECIRISAVAEAFGIEMVPHNFASALSLAANLHVAAAAATGGWIEVDSNLNPFLWEIDKNSAFSLSDGEIEMPELPGLGVEPDLNKLEEITLSDG